MDESGRVLVCDRDNSRVQIFDGEGRYLTEWGGLLRPTGIFCQDVVYVTELGGRVSILGSDGEILSRFGEKGNQPGQFQGWPHGAWVDSRGDLYVSEVRGDALLHKFSRVG